MVTISWALLGFSWFIALTIGASLGALAVALGSASKRADEDDEFTGG